ncbi:NAC domain-containing protein 2-like [Macadamia integrifolia]|uniref:NAC domain-containing protein 2-like n=1 Tax=Macadamia integrifolia TaxID=60698 RepID=UPI001C4ECEF6|nr:NAC domain-containing protein 2-like [Macadamia integrifolia]
MSTSSHDQTGFYFYPIDSEVINCLKEKLLGRFERLRLPAGLIPDTINPYSYDPLTLPKGDDFEHVKRAFFFTNKQENRTVKDGFWRASTLPEKIFSTGQMLGFKEEFNFFWSIRNETIKTNWIMNEYSVNQAIFSEDERKAIGNKIGSYIVCELRYESEYDDLSDDDVVDDDDEDDDDDKSE